MRAIETFGLLLRTVQSCRMFTIRKLHLKLNFSGGRLPDPPRWWNHLAILCWHLKKMNHFPETSRKIPISRWRCCVAPNINIYSDPSVHGLKQRNSFDGLKVIIFPKWKKKKKTLPRRRLENLSLRPHLYMCFDVYAVKRVKLVWPTQTGWGIMGVKQLQSLQSIHELSVSWRADVSICSEGLFADTLDETFILIVYETWLLQSRSRQTIAVQCEGWIKHPVIWTIHLCF